MLYKVQSTLLREKIESVDLGFSFVIIAYNCIYIFSPMYRHSDMDVRNDGKPTHTDINK